MEPIQKQYDVGVIIGRFQVPYLHQAHHDFIDSVFSKHKKVIILLGISPCKATRNNPLDFEARKNMLLAEYPRLIILCITDSSSDSAWSKNLDLQVNSIIAPSSTVVLYGGRDSFIGHYQGNFDTYELQQQQKEFISGTQICKQVSVESKASVDFRTGCIVTAFNQYPKVFPTIDVAIWNGSYTELLMARKEDEKQYRFIGGFAEKSGSYEDDVKREVEEETHLAIGDINYIGSGEVNDWRYVNEVDGIKTIFFDSKYVFGHPIPNDDIVELKWFTTRNLEKDEIVTSHLFLLEMLINKYPERF